MKNKLTMDQCLEARRILRENQIQPGEWLTLLDGTRWYFNHKREFEAPIFNEEKT